MKKMVATVTLILGLCVLWSGCGNDDDGGDTDTNSDSESSSDTGTGSDGMTCESGDFKVTGTVDSNPVNISAGADGRYIINTGDGTFTGSGDDGSSITLNWSGMISNGQVTAVTGGTLSFGTAIEKIDSVTVVAGTITLGDNVEFELTELTSEDSTPIPGSLTGCHYNN